MIICDRYVKNGMLTERCDSADNLGDSRQWISLQVPSVL